MTLRFNHSSLILGSLTGLFLLGACEVTPYDVTPDLASCSGVSVSENIQKLVALERANIGKKVFKVAIFSDSHENLSSMERAVDRINRRSDIDFVMVLGDLTDNGLKAQFDFACKNLAKLNKPVFAIIGNHDSISNGKEIWLKTFGAFNYSFSYLGSKFIAYNDNAFEFQNVPDQSFIQSEAKIQPGETRIHTIAASHVQPNSEVHDVEFQKQFLKMMAEAGVHLTIHGHRHAFYYDKDAYGNNHHVVGWTKEDAWSVMTVNQTSIKMEDCRLDTCTEVNPI